MIHVSSYLRTRDGGFVSVCDALDAPSNPQHIEGAIELSVNDTLILDKSLWDDVDQLWAYVCDMVRSLNEADEVSTLFPDQPIRLKFRRVGGGYILVSLTYDDVRRCVSVEERYFILALQQAGESFFQKLKELLPGNARGYDDALNRLAAYRTP